MRIRYCISSLVHITFDHKSKFGFLAIAVILSGENFFYDGICVGYGVRS